MLDRFLAGDFPITIAVFTIMWLWASRHRSTVREIVFDRSTVWAWVGRVTVGTAVLLPLWIALVDNWRQIMGYGVEESSRWMSDPFRTAPPPDAVRWLSLILIAVLVAGAATIYARQRGSLGLALFLLPVTVGYFFFLNAIRMRADALLRITTEGSLASEHPVNIGFTLFWSTGLYFFVASLIVAGFLALVALLAVPLRLVFMMFERQEAEREAAVFSMYRSRVPGTLPADQSQANTSPIGDNSARH